MKTRVSIFVLLITSLTLTGCFETKRKTNQSNSSSTTNNLGNDTYQYTPGTGTTTPSDNGGYGDGTEEGEADAGQTQNYFSLNNIIVHSKDHSSNDGKNYLWSSSTNIDSGSQNIFVTDARFNVRVRAQAAPPKGNDSNGTYCTYQEYEGWYRYTKLEVDICLRSQAGTCVYTHTFSDVPVGEVSKVKEFTVPVSSQALVLEVLDVRWDTGCLYDRGASERYCPYARVWQNDCVKFDIQFSTDYTKDFPSSAPRY